jgi:hypothetical protein
MILIWGSAVTFLLLTSVSKVLQNNTQQEQVAEQPSPSPTVIATTDPDGFWTGEVTVNSSATNTIYCKTVTSELAKIGRLATLHNNPTCAQWMPNPKYYEQDTISRNRQKQEAKTDEDKRAIKELKQALNLITAYYADNESKLTSAYNQTVRNRTSQFIQGDITAGNHDVSRHLR